MASIELSGASADLSVVYGARTWDRVEKLILEAARSGGFSGPADEETRGIVAYFARKIRRATEGARRGRPALADKTTAAAASVESLCQLACGCPPKGPGRLPDVREALRNIDAALRRRGRPPGRRDASTSRTRGTRRIRLAVDLERVAVVKDRAAEKNADLRTRRLLALDPEASLSVDEVAIRRVARVYGWQASTVRRRYYESPGD
jgi:hypothetical protein